KILKEFNVAGELIRARQEEKQGLLDDFDSESKRFFFGKISERALSSSVKKTNTELQRLDGDLRTNIARSRRAGGRATALVSAQVPIKYRATLSGIVGGEMKKVARKKKKKKAPVKKKKAPVKKKKAPVKKKKAPVKKQKQKQKKAPTKKKRKTTGKKGKK
ncbi:unnamed protein product, partial [marine sediment metagenome]